LGLDQIDFTHDDYLNMFDSEELIQTAMNILVCEDNNLTLRSIEQVLSKAGYPVLKAKDGREGIRILSEGKVQLLITDINMPYSLGLELVRYVNTSLTKKIPSIIVTGFIDENTRKHALELGATGYFIKPLDLDELVGQVNVLLHQA
jgi:DNA-binding response OmpR family regulator